MSNVPSDGFKWRNNKFSYYNEFIQSYDEHSNKRSILEVDVIYPKELQKTHISLPFLPEKMKIDKYQKQVGNLNHKKISHTRKSFEAETG